MMLCRDPEGGYAHWICPGCQSGHRLPFSCKTRFCPSCGKVRVDNWVNNITKDMLEVPHLHITLTCYDGQQVIFWYIDTSTHQCKTVTCSALDFISLLVPHIPPKGMQMVRYAGLYARNLKHKIAPILLAALETLRLQFPLFDIQSLLVTAGHRSWRERIKASFGYDPLLCSLCGRTLELVEIWEPKRGHIWMKRWLKTHRLGKAARNAKRQLQQARPASYRQLAFNFDP